MPALGDTGRYVNSERIGLHGEPFTVVATYDGAEMFGVKFDNWNFGSILSPEDVEWT